MSGRSPRDRVRSSAPQEELGVEPCSFVPAVAQGSVSDAPLGRCSQQGPQGPKRDPGLSGETRAGLGAPRTTLEELEKVSGEGKVWASLPRLLTPGSGPR